jgi:Rhodopirellula transposase DDE domain
MGYSLQANRKTLEGASHPDRDAQFHHISSKIREGGYLLDSGDPYRLWFHFSGAAATEHLTIDL